MFEFTHPEREKEMEEKSDGRSKNNGWNDLPGRWIAIGLGVGAALGIAFDNLGIGVGLALGIAIGSKLNARTCRRQDEQIVNP